MRAFEFLVEAEAPAAIPKKVGREFNHLEDLVFTEPDGAKNAIDVLKDLGQDASTVSIKWDGSPTVYWGRELGGEFVLVGKNNWGRPEGLSKSPQELEQFILSRGKGEEWRPQFAKDMASLWPIFERATPQHFRGYVYGDLLFTPGKPYQGADGNITFTPNQTTYTVRADSEIGRRLVKAKVAVAAHKYFKSFGDKEGEDFTDVSMFDHTPDLHVFAQTYVSHQPAVKADSLRSLEQLAAQSQHKINALLEPKPGLSDLRNIIYTFVNQQSKAKALNDINTASFFKWLPNSKVSTGKQQKIAELNQAHRGVFDNIYQLVRMIMQAKDEVIAELDSAQNDITAHTAGKPGGEGYVSTKHSVKLVPRDRWTPFRAD